MELIKAKSKFSFASAWKEFVKRLREAFVVPFKKDDRLKLSYTEKMEFTNQVKELESSAIKNV